MQIGHSWNIHSRYSYTVVAGPATTPISLAEVKSHLRLDPSDTSEDTYLTLLIEAAVDCAEAYTKRTLINTTFETYRQGFYDLELRRSKLQSISSIQYYDAEDSIQTVGSSLYRFSPDTDYSTVTLANGSSWPTSGLSERDYPVTVTFIAGFGASDTDVPTDLRIALLNHVSKAYSDRGDCCDDANTSEAIPSISRGVYDKYKINDINGNQDRFSRLGVRI